MNEPLALTLNMPGQQGGVGTGEPVSSPPIGVFDSGFGGLSVVADLLRREPRERIIYLGDTAHVPYGPRPVAEIQAFSCAIGHFLVAHYGVRCLVIACNTATSAAAEVVRQELAVPVVGMEPAVKPAAAVTRSGVVGVLATASTLTGPRFHALVQRYAEGVTVLTQPCPELVQAVEAGAIETPETRAAIARYTGPLLERGADTLVLGCTHFPLLRATITAVVGPEITLIETGPAVARRVYEVSPFPQVGTDFSTSPPRLTLLTTGEVSAFSRIAHILLRSAGVDSALETGSVSWVPRYSIIHSRCSL